MKECGQVPPLGYREIPLTLVQGMAASLIRFSVAVRVRRAEHPLPSRLAAGAGALLGEREGQLDPSSVVAQVALVPARPRTSRTSQLGIRGWRKGPASGPM